MHFVSVESFCTSTGLSKAQVDDFEQKGLIASVTKGKQRFYSLREVYRAKGIVYFMRTAGLTPEEARAKVDAKQN
jgi:DNA-binding transcriptional MerR regulator